MERFACIREPDDSIADIRVSVGYTKGIGGYLVFRGAPEDAISVLEVALTLAKEALPKKLYSDHRNPQG